VTSPDLVLVGLGPWGRILAGAVERAGMRLAAAADPDPRARRGFARRYPHIPLLADPAEVLQPSDDGDGDAVLLATPIETHAPLAERALRAGRHVWVEKPLALRARTALALAELAVARGRALFVDHTFLFSPAVAAAEKLIAAGTLGTVHHVDAARLNFGAVRGRLGPLWELGPHDLSILCFLFGRPSRVLARADGWVRPGVHDCCLLEVRWDSGVTAHITLSWAHPEKVRRMVIIGSRGSLIYRELETGPDLVLHRSFPEPGAGRPGSVRMVRGTVGPVSLRRQEPLVQALGAFMAAADGRADSRCRVHLALEVVAALEAAQRSLAGGREESVDIV